MSNFTLPQNIDYPVVIFAWRYRDPPFISFLESISEPETICRVWLYYAERNVNSDTHHAADQTECVSSSNAKIACY